MDIVAILCIASFLLFLSWIGGKMLEYLNGRKSPMVAYNLDDDAQVPTEEWLRSIGFDCWDYSECNGVRKISYTKLGECMLSFSELRGLFTWSGGYSVQTRVVCDTRRKVRLICELLGVELKE